jgi:hypothetical protein
MLIAMRKTTANRVCEDRAAYRTEKGSLFSHEDLEVYQTALRLTRWVESLSTAFACSADLLSKLDTSTTSLFSICRRQRPIQRSRSREVSWYRI